MKNNELVLAAPLDIDGAFNHTTVDRICMGVKDDTVYTRS